MVQSANTQLPVYRILGTIIEHAQLHNVFDCVHKYCGEREREMFYLTTHSTHFIYGYMASDIWLRTILIVRKETRCCHIGYSYWLTARVLLYAPSHRQDNTYHSLCYTSRGALAGTRNKILWHDKLLTWKSLISDKYISTPGVVLFFLFKLKCYIQYHVILKYLHWYSFVTTHPQNAWNQTDLEKLKSSQLVQTM